MSRRGASSCSSHGVRKAGAAHPPEVLAIVLALTLAGMAAAMSTGTSARRCISNYIAEALQPTVVDLGPRSGFVDPESLFVPDEN